MVCTECTTKRPPSGNAKSKYHRKENLKKMLMDDFHWTHRQPPIIHINNDGRKERVWNPLGLTWQDGRLTGLAWWFLPKLKSIMLQQIHPSRGEGGVASLRPHRHFRVEFLFWGVAHFKTSLKAWLRKTYRPAWYHFSLMKKLPCLFLKKKKKITNV